MKYKNKAGMIYAGKNTWLTPNVEEAIKDLKKKRKITAKQKIRVFYMSKAEFILAKPKRYKK